VAILGHPDKAVFELEDPVTAIPTVHPVSLVEWTIIPTSPRAADEICPPKRRGIESLI